MSTRDLARIGIPILIVVIIFISIIVAVYFPPSGKLVCTLSSAPGETRAKYTYTIKFKSWKVRQIETKEVIMAEDKDILQKFADSEREYSKEFESVDYYQRDIKIDGKKMTSITTVQYDKIKKKKVSSDDNYIKRKNLHIGHIKKMYQELGASCKYK